MTAPIDADLRRHHAPSGESWYDLGYYSRDTMGRRIGANVERWPLSPLTYLSAYRPGKSTQADTWAAALRIAAALLEAGVKPGDRVAVQLPCWHECVVAYLACIHAGFVLVPLVTIFGVHEVGYIVRNSGARTYICPNLFKGKDFIPIARDLLAAGLIDNVVIVGADKPPMVGTSWEDLYASTPNIAPAGPNAPDDVVLILYTSGTTADPKGARHTHNTFTADLTASNYAETDVEQISLNIFPAGHTAGTLALLRPFFSGEASYTMDEWSAEVAVRTIDKYRITRSGGTPFHLTQMIEVAEKSSYDLSSLTTFIIGATNVTPALVEHGLQHGVISCRCYGSTEHPTVSAAKTSDPPYKRAFTDGRLLAGDSVRLVDEDGKDLPPGEEGEILTNGPELFVGYTNPELNAECFVDGIWFKTGDVGRIDDEGFLCITDRKKDIVIRGGENISSREVEEALFQHPAINEVAVVPYPDKLMGERVCAFIVLNPGASFTLADADAHFRQLGLARQKTPERLEFLDEMPRTPIGKIRKQDLKAIVRRGPEASAAL